MRLVDIKAQVEPKRRKDKPTARAPKCTWLDDLATNHLWGSNEGVVKITRLEVWVNTPALSSTNNKVKNGGNADGIPNVRTIRVHI